MWAINSKINKFNLYLVKTQKVIFLNGLTRCNKLKYIGSRSMKTSERINFCDKEF